MAVFKMSICRMPLVFLITLCVVTITACSHDIVVTSNFSHTVPTIFTNSEGATIKISTEGMLVGGGFYKATDCSNEKFNCFKYDNKALFITPKFCYMPHGDSWRVGNLSSQWKGYEYSSDSIQNHFGNSVGYTFSEIKGKGIVGIAYDVEGIYHITAGENFYGNIPSERMNDMLYFSPVGPAFLPCVKAWKKR
jgi:hypothetical protein